MWICPPENDWRAFAIALLAGVMLLGNCHIRANGKTESVPMKKSSDTSFLSRPETLQPYSEANPAGHLFLGHKVLGELRILMRLSSTASADDGADSKGPGGQSF